MEDSHVLPQYQRDAKLNYEIQMYHGYHNNAGEGNTDFAHVHAQQQYYAQGQAGGVTGTPPPYQCVPAGLRPLYGGTGQNPMAVNASNSWNKYGQAWNMTPRRLVPRNYDVQCDVNDDVGQT